MKATVSAYQFDEFRQLVINSVDATIAYHTEVAHKQANEKFVNRHWFKPNVEYSVNSEFGDDIVDYMINNPSRTGNETPKQKAFREEAFTFDNNKLSAITRTLMQIWDARRFARTILNQLKAATLANADSITLDQEELKLIHIYETYLQ